MYSWTCRGPDRHQDSSLYPVVTGPFAPPQLSRLSLCQTPSRGFWPPVIRDKDSVTSSGPDLEGRQIHLSLCSICMQASLCVKELRGEDGRKGTEHLRNVCCSPTVSVVSNEVGFKMGGHLAAKEIDD